MTERTRGDRDKSFDDIDDVDRDGDADREDSRQEASDARDFDADDEPRRHSGFFQWLKELPMLLAIAFVAALLLKTFIIQPFYIPSGSMEQTLHGCPGCAGDKILVNKMSYWFTDPEPGDIVVFEGDKNWAPEFNYAEPDNVFGQAWLWLERAVGAAPPNEKDFVKRVIAVGGQTVQCCDEQGRVTVDGVPLDEGYIYVSPDAVPGNADVSTYRQQEFGPAKVPKGRLFVMGDHRNGSADSRAHVNDQYQGTIAVDSVVGRAFVILWPVDRFAWLSSPDTKVAALGSQAPIGLLVRPPVVAMLLVAPLSIGRARRRSRAAARSRGHWQVH